VTSKESIDPLLNGKPAAEPGVGVSAAEHEEAAAAVPPPDHVIDDLPALLR